MRTSVLVVDAQQLVREGLRALLAGSDDIEVVGDAGDGRSAVSFVASERPDIVVIDTQLPRLSGIEAIRRIREESPQTGCVALSSLEGPGQVREALLAGASGFLPKDSPTAHLVQAVRTVAAGRSYLAPSMADQVISVLRSPQDPATGSTSELTSRQREVLQLIAEGLSTKEIADELGISEKTVQTHRAKLMGRTGIRKASALVRYAIREGIVSA